MFDVIDGGGQHALVKRGDAAGHFIGREARVLPGDADHRNADIGKDIHRRAQRGERACDQNQQRQHDKRVRAPKGNANEIHGIPMWAVRYRQLSGRRRHRERSFQ